MKANISHPLFMCIEVFPSKIPRRPVNASIAFAPLAVTAGNSAETVNNAIAFALPAVTAGNSVETANAAIAFAQKVVTAGN